MFKKILLITCLSVFATFASGSVSVKADTATAASMIPVLRAMYHVDEAEAVLHEKKDLLKQCKKRRASAVETALAQAEVNYATNLLNTLNTMITRDSIIIEAAPAGVVNPPSFAVNSLAVQNAWLDYFSRTASLRNPCPVLP